MNQPSTISLERPAPKTATITFSNPVPLQNPSQGVWPGVLRSATRPVVLVDHTAEYLPALDRRFSGR